MKRFSNLIGRSKNSSSPTSALDTVHSASDTPDTAASRAIRIFCESGSTSNHDEEVLQLPTIVDGAESSPAAAAACALQIRAFLDVRKYAAKPHVHYNAIMLTRILSDHPGASFTRNFDDKFVRTVKTLLREGRDASVQQMLRETLDVIEATRSDDAGVLALVAMWRREKGKQASFEQRYPRAYPAPPPGAASRARGEQSGGLPPPAELSSRIEESRNTAKILIQFLQTTPSEEIYGNELIREFSERCDAAQRSMQGFINCQNPVPDDDTLQTLIETNEQLSLASSRYQRAVLAARRAMGGSSPGETGRTGSVPVAAPQLPPPVQQETSLFAPTPRSTQNGFGTFGSTNGSYGFGNNTSTLPPALPPKSAPHHQPQVSTESRVSAAHFDDNDDDLYDSPVAARAPAADPFADPEPARGPVAHTEASSTYSSQTPTTAPTSSSPVSTTRPAVPWHNSTITESFLGRQTTAADGLTMSPPPGVDSRAELDAHSNVGRS